MSASLLEADGRKTRRANSRTRRAAWGYLFISPWIIGFLVFNLYPILAVLYYGFTSYSGLSAPRWVGLENYVEIFTYDTLALKAMSNTVTYVLMRVPLHLGLGLLAAVLIDNKLRGINLLSTMLYLPTIVPYVTTVILWMWLLDFEYGVVNAVLRELGFSRINWLGSVNLAKPSIVIMGLWQIGVVMMIFLAGLRNIPEQLYEAAEIDGATPLSRFTSITLPLLTPVIFFNLVLDIINSFQSFAASFIATNGGPLNSTLFLVLYIYRQSFSYLRLGYGSALAAILFAIIFILTIVVMRSERKWVFYDRT